MVLVDAFGVGHSSSSVWQLGRITCAVVGGAIASRRGPTNVDPLRCQLLALSRGVALPAMPLPCDTSLSTASPAVPWPARLRRYLLCVAVAAVPCHAEHGNSTHSLACHFSHCRTTPHHTSPALTRHASSCSSRRSLAIAAIPGPTAPDQLMLCPTSPRLPILSRPCHALQDLAVLACHVVPGLTRPFRYSPYLARAAAPTLAAPCLCTPFSTSPCLPFQNSCALPYLTNPCLP